MAQKGPSLPRCLKLGTKLRVSNNLSDFHTAEIETKMEMKKRLDHPRKTWIPSGSSRPLRHIGCVGASFIEALESKYSKKDAEYTGALYLTVRSQEPDFVSNSLFLHPYIEEHPGGPM